MARSQPIPLPQGWPKFVRSGVLHAISLGATTMTSAWARATKARSKRRLQADIDRLRVEAARFSVLPPETGPGPTLGSGPHAF